MHSNGKPIRAFVQLAVGFGARVWNEKWKRGEIVGVNEPFAYGYFHANDFGCAVEYSEDFPEGRLAKLVRLGFRAILGFDLVHAWRNRRAMRSADVVWTHTESQGLAVAALLCLTPRQKRPRLVLQNVWLIDRWPRYGALRRLLFKYLLRQADILTFHSEENLARARQLFPGVRCELVLFGIKADEKAETTRRPVIDTVRLISVGNDEHRDWRILVEAVANQPDFQLKIISHTVNPDLLRDCRNIEIVKPRLNEELREIYNWADLLVLPLKQNSHCSGTTVLQEAALNNLPAICSDVGGLRSYFGPEAVFYVPPGNAEAIRAAVRALASSNERRTDMARLAAARMGPEGLSSLAYARRHAELSRSLLESAQSQLEPKPPAEVVAAGR